MQTLNHWGRIFAVALGIAALTASGGSTQEPGQIFTPSDLQWKPGRLPGVESAPLIGDPFKPGLYLSMMRFPPKFITQPHSHSEARQCTVLSGTLYIGWGEQFDATKLKALPPGSFYTEPANTPHFLATKGDSVIVQITGIGPVATIFVIPEAATNQK
jgi:quercetin dioxygenase-like cupin family protein